MPAHSSPLSPGVLSIDALKSIAADAVSASGLQPPRTTSAPLSNDVLSPGALNVDTLKSIADAISASGLQLSPPTRLS
jgi:hypothetical protein